MKMFNKIGAVRTLPKPSTTEANAALNFLSIFGDPQKLKKLLTEIRDVQAHNDQVLKDATATIAEASKAQAKLEADRERHEREHSDANALIASDAEKLTRREVRLADRIAAFDKYEKARTQELTEHRAELDLGHEDLKTLLRSYETNKKELQKDQARLAEAQNKLNAEGTSLKAREAKLRAVMDS